MAVTLTFDPVLSRVQITATALGAADVALVERSTDQVRWTTVRGGSAWPVTAGAFSLTLDDYEFSDALTYYRVSGVETGAVTFVATGAAASAVNASVTPAQPAGIVEGDLLLTLASIRNSGTGTVDTPAGWSVVRSFGNVALLGRRYVSGDAAPIVTFTGGAANADTLARMAAFRRAELVPVTGVDLLNGSAQDAPYPALTVPQDDLTLIDVSWKQDDYSANTARDGTFTSIGGVTSTTGDDAGMSWWYAIQTTATDLPSGTHTVTGGGAAISRSMTIALEHAPYLQQQTASITPAQEGVWLKSIARPFLNKAVDTVQPARTSISRPARVGVFDIVGRSLPVAVSDIRSSRRWVMQVRTETEADAVNVGYLLASGDVLLIQVPAACSALIPAGYVAVGDVDESAHALRPLERTFTLPVTEVSPPGPGVVGAASTWASVLALYGSWEALLVDHVDWASVLTLVGSPSEVIVP